MAKRFARKLYNGTAWKKLRKQYYNYANGLCERCLAKGEYIPGDEVHHKIELTPENINDPDITLGWDKLELLCFSCHQKETWGRKEAGSTTEGLMFDEDGNLVEIDGQ